MKFCKSIVVLFVMSLLLISFCSIGVSAAKIEWEDKIPLDTPWFKPVIDGQRDGGYSEEYTVQNKLQYHEIHEGGSKLSTAWYGNTLYFYIWVPDATASETTSSMFYQIDNVWFLLYFGEEANESVKWSQNEMVKTFRILPFANVLNFKGQVNDHGAFPPKSENFEWKVNIQENVGYAIEVAYTVPQEIATLVSGFECAFEVEVLDVCEGTTNFLDYRYVMGEAQSENDIENFPYAYGAKIVLGAGEAVTTEPVTESETEDTLSETHGETTTVPQEEKTVGVFVAFGVVTCVLCVAFILVAVFSKKKTLKIAFIALALVCAILAMVFFGSGFGETSTEDPEGSETTGAFDSESAPVSDDKPQVIQHDFLVDRFFKNGMTYTSHKIPGAIVGSLSYGSGSAAWDYGMLGSKYDIVKDGTYTQIAEGIHQYEDESKLLYIDTNTGEFKMGIKGSKEYDSPRKANEGFPGTLITTQEMTQTIFLPDLASVKVTLDFTLDYVINQMSESEFNDGLHTAQWNYYLFVSDSKSNEWFYVGLPLYDYRHEAGNVHGTDPGTGAFSYIPSYNRAFGNARVKVGERFTQTVDILPFIKTAFRIAQQNGYLKGCSYQDLYISGFNYGWELPGTFDCMATSHALNITYTLIDEVS